MGSSLTKFAVAAVTVQFGLVSAFAPALRSLSRNPVAVAARVRETARASSSLSAPRTVAPASSAR